MKTSTLSIIFQLLTLVSFSQVAIGLKGTRITIDSSKWRLSGSNIIAKNSGNIGIGTANPAAQLHTTGSVRFEGIGTNTTQSRVMTTDASGNVTTRVFSNLLAAELAALPTGILKTTTGTGALSIATAIDFPILNQNTTGNAATVTTNANLTGPVQSVGNATSISANVIANSMLSQVTSPTFKGRTTAGTGNVEDLTPTQATAMLNTFTSTAKGLVPASGGGTTTFLRADGTFASPITSGRQFVSISADVTNSSPTGNTLIDVTGLSFNVVAGTTYRFYALIPFTSSSTSSGTRWTINTPATTYLSYLSRYTLSASSETVNYANAPNLPANCNNNSNANGNLAVIEGVIIPSASGTVQVRFAGETGGVQVTAKAGASLEWW